MKKKKALVLGATGQDGSYMIDLLLKKNKPKEFSIKFYEGEKKVLEYNYELFKRQKTKVMIRNFLLMKKT